MLRKYIEEAIVDGPNQPIRTFSIFTNTTAFLCQLWLLKVTSKGANKKLQKLFCFGSFRTGTYCSKLAFWLTGLQAW